MKFLKEKRIYWKFRKFIIYTCMFIVLTWSILQQQMSTCIKLFSYLKQQSFIYCILCICTLSSAKKKKLPWILTFIRCIDCNHVAYMHVWFNKTMNIFYKCWQGWLTLVRSVNIMYLFLLDSAALPRVHCVSSSPIKQSVM